MPISIDFIVTTALNGLVQGVVLVLVAAGLSLVFGLMRVVNFAHGSFFMIGAYAGALIAPTAGYFLAMLAALVVGGILGVVVEYLMIRPLYGKEPVVQILATFGIALMIRESIKWIYGTGSLSMSTPSYLRGPVSVAGISYSLYSLFLLFVGIVVIVALDYVLQSTDVGSIIRGASRDPGMIRMLGIDINHYWTGLFGVGAALAALAGMLVSPIQPITPTMDFSMLLLAFVVVIFGGMGSYRGSVVAGLVLGQVMAFTTIFWAPGSNVIALVVLAVALLVQPEGLLGEPEVLE